MLKRISRQSSAGSEGGFTLIELLVVIIIIGILAAIAIPMYLNQRTKGFDAQTQSDLRNAAVAEESYFTANHVYTDNANGELQTEGFHPTQGVTVTPKLYNNGTSYCLDADNSQGGSHWDLDNSSNSASGAPAQANCP